MGSLALLIVDVDDPAALAHTLSRSGGPFVDIVPAACTVLVTVRHRGDIDEARSTVEAIDSVEWVDVPSGDVTIDVSYDGDDLADVAASVGMSVAEVVETHASAHYRVEFCGFAPGFGYLSGLPAAMHLPRRATPRTRVPAGSVAIASEYSAVYPTDSPGGWHLLGSTSMSMFDAARTPPALLRPGTRVTFRPK